MWLLLHGFMGSPESWSRVLSCAELDRTPLTPTLAGHGLDWESRAVQSFDSEVTRLASLASSAVWIQRGALAYQASNGEPHPEEEEDMERLLALKQISLFNGLSLDQLEAVHQVTTEVDYLEGEVIMREGEHDDQLYLLLEGRVRVYKNYGTANPTVLNELEAVTYIGEMAVLDGEPRSASIVASQHCRLLSLNGTSLRELVLQMPEISFEIFRVLATRVRVAESRLGN